MSLWSLENLIAINVVPADGHIATVFEVEAAPILFCITDDIHAMADSTLTVLGDASSRSTTFARA
jgi:hypothetical protein